MSEIRPVYVTGGTSPLDIMPNRHGDAVAIGTDDNGLYSINVFPSRGPTAWAKIDRSELAEIAAAINRELAS